MSKLPLYQRAIDWNSFWATYPPPDDFVESTYRWSADQLATHQNARFIETMQAGWKNPFYRRLWSKQGLEPGDVRSLEDIVKLPTYTSDDVKADQQEFPPYGYLGDLPDAQHRVNHAPLKLQSSGGTTGKPRLTLQGAIEWEVLALSTARSLYIQGARPGDIMQIPRTCSLATVAWAFYKACHDYLGIMPLTTGSGLVTRSRQQIEGAKDVGTNIWTSNAQYLLRLAKVCREEFGHEISDLNTKFITTFLGPDTEGTLRSEIESLWGCRVYDNYGTNEIGLCASECGSRNGLHFSEDLNYFEILDRQTLSPVAPGGVGNVVVTSFWRRIQPMIRYNLRDLTRVVSSERCECGSTFRRMDHFLGRSDSMVKIRGVIIYPLACLASIRSDPRTTGEWLCEAYTDTSSGQPTEEMRVHVEFRRGVTVMDELKENLERRLKADLGLRVEVQLVPEGSLESNVNQGEGKTNRLLERRVGYSKA